MALRFATPATDVYHYPLIIRHLLSGAMQTAPEERIHYRDRMSYTYREFAGRVGRLASMLEKLGAEPGMTIAVMDWDSHRYLEAYFAIPMMGAVLQTVNVRLPPPQITYTLAHAEAEIILCHQDFFPQLEAALPMLPRVKAVVAIMDGATTPLPRFAAGEYEALSEAASPDYAFQDFDENAVATHFYTTGTTGNPKAVCFTHRQLVLHALSACGPFGASAQSQVFGFGDIYMPLTPMFHVHAWGMPYVATMLGLKQIYPGRYEADMICRLRQEHGVTYSHCVPTILRMVLDTAAANGVDLTGWKLTIGGSALSRPLYRAATERGMELMAGYGMSETAPLVSVARPRPSDGDDPEKLSISMTAAGVPVPLVEARIVDEAMNPLPRDGVARGELVLRAPWLTPCYVGDAAASEALWRGGWLHTQDVASIDPDGQIHIRDRLKDVIKTGGEWIDSLQLEELVAAADGVAEASVVAVPDDQWGERPLALVVPKPNAVITLETLNTPVEAAIRTGAITRYARLERFEVVNELPRTSVGKIDKKLLRARYAEAAAARAAVS